MDKYNKTAFNATNDHGDEAQSYAAYIKNKAHKGFLPFDDWAKLQTCHHCGNEGHVCPRCHKYLAAKANGTLTPSSEKQRHMPASAPPKDCRDKLQKDPKLKALLSAFQPSPPNILLSHNLMTMKMQPQITMQMMLQTSLMMRMTSTPFGEWWEL